MGAPFLHRGGPDDLLGSPLSAVGAPVAALHVRPDRPFHVSDARVQGGAPGPGRDGLPCQSRGVRTHERVGVGSWTRCVQVGGIEGKDEGLPGQED